MSRFHKPIVLLCLLIFGTGQLSFAQGKKVKVLFIGTGISTDLPLLTYQMASSMGDTLVYETRLIGGYNLKQHSYNTQTLDAVKKGGWDYVVLQEYLTLPALDLASVEANVYPYARKLDSLVHVYSPCANTIFCMPWGMKGGDMENCKSWPYVCTCDGMDSFLRERYLVMAHMNNASVAPVGVVWHYLRHNYPNLELYTSDGIYPSEAGGYAAALTLYTAIFKRSPVLSNFTSTLTPTDAAYIKSAEKALVFDSVNLWSIGTSEPIADFDYVRTGTVTNFINNSKNATSYYWDFGDGQTSALVNPVHSYPVLSVYATKLTVTASSGCNDVMYRYVNLFPTGINDGALASPQFVLSPNPVTDILYISSSLFLSKTCQISVINTLGQTIFQHQTGRVEKQELGLSGLGSQLYILTISADGQEYFRQKFIKH